MLSCIGIDKISIWCKFQVSTFFKNNKILNIGTRDIEWISNFVKIWNSNAHKSLIWLSGRHFMIDKIRQTYEKSCIDFSNLKFNKIHFYGFLTQNNLRIFVIFTYFFNI